MRAMEIPARIVAGYQGGEINPATGHITVRQYDAHAWVEVWLEGEGWVSIDPTAQVAPNRISLGIRNAVANEEFLTGANFSLIKMSHFAWMNDLRLKIDQLNYQWHQTVLNFNKQKQSQKLKEWFGKDALKKSLYWLAGLFISVFFAMTLILLWKRKKARLTPLQKSLGLLDKRLLSLELKRDSNEGLADYSLRLQQAFPPQKDVIRRLFEQLQSQYYKPPSSNDTHIQAQQKEKQLAVQIKKLSRQLAAIAKNKNNLRQ